MSVWVTGDTHGMYDDLIERISENNVKENDSIIVTGDFGFVSGRPERRKAFLSLMRENYRFWFIDGNAEEYPFLETFRIELWSSGNARIITPNIVHLMRGEVYEIECGGRRKTIFCMGGAYSVDRQYRCEGVDWFPQELPSLEAYVRADRALEGCRYKVDHIITHTAPPSVAEVLGFSIAEEEYVLSSYLEELRRRVVFDQWFFGHFHTDKRLPSGFTAVHDKMIRIL